MWETAQRWLRGTCSVIGEVVGIQCIVTAFVKDAAVKLIFTGAGGDADDGSGSLTIFRSIGVGEHLEFSNGVDGRVDKNGAVGAYVVVVHAVDQKQVVGAGVAVHREV